MKKKKTTLIKKRCIIIKNKDNIKTERKRDIEDL
jgi:hypothetical protein